MNRTGLCRPCYKRQYEYDYCISRYKSDSAFRDKQKDRALRYQSNNLEARILYKTEYTRRREKVDVSFHLSNCLRSRLNKAIKNNQKTGSAVKDLGCSIPELKKHLENQFQPGMTWENHTRDGWHIDHIKPLASFDLTNPKELKEACHYTNLQPLWARDNLSKGCELKRRKSV